MKPNGHNHSRWTEELRAAAAVCGQCGLVFAHPPPCAPASSEKDAALQRARERVALKERAWYDEQIAKAAEEWFEEIGPGEGFVGEQALAKAVIAKRDHLATKTAEATPASKANGRGTVPK